jgi:hypothetical protein
MAEAWCQLGLGLGRVVDGAERRPPVFSIDQCQGEGTRVKGTSFEAESRLLPGSVQAGSWGQLPEIPPLVC